MIYISHLIPSASLTWFRDVNEIIIIKKTLQKKGDQMYLNLTEIGAIKKKAFLKSQNALVKATKKDFIDTNEVDTLNKDIAEKERDLSTYYYWYDEFKEIYNTKKEGE